MYNFYERLRQIFILDNIRIGKLIEILQYSFIFYILILATTYGLNKFYYDHTDKHESKKQSLMKLGVSLLMDVFMIVIVLFYLRKIGLLIPSVPSLIVPEFRSHTTLEYSIHISLVVLFIELLPRFKQKIEHFNEIMLS